MTEHAEYLSQRDHIEAALASICRRERLAPADADDFCSSFRLRLIEDDYAMLRAFQGRSSLRTYLLAVVAHAYQDWRNARWGKWRNSTEARRLGPLAVILERLVVRDGLTLDEAYETLRTNYGRRESRAAIEQLAAMLPARVPRKFVSADVLLARQGAAHGGESALRQSEAAADAARMTAAVAAAVDRLTPQDRLILRMRFEEGVTVVRIAKALDLDQKALYRRIDRMLAALRAALQAAGLTAESAREVLEARGFDLVERPRETPGPVRQEGEGRRVETVRGE